MNFLSQLPFPQNGPKQQWILQEDNIIRSRYEQVKQIDPNIAEANEDCSKGHEEYMNNCLEYLELWDNYLREILEEQGRTRGVLLRHFENKKWDAALEGKIMKKFYNSVGFFSKTK